MFVRVVTDTFTVYEKLIAMSCLEGQTKGSDSLKCVLKNVINFGLSLENLVGVTTDGPPNMIGKIQGWFPCYRSSWRMIKNYFKFITLYISIICAVSNLVFSCNESCSGYCKFH